MSKQNGIQDMWQRLYDAADKFRDAAPWIWMQESNLFAVQDPQTNELGFCSVLGNNGEHFALNVYRGAEGLAKLIALTYMDEIPPMTGLQMQKCLAVSFEDRAELWPEDLKQIKSLKRRYRGRNKWPLFRNFEPGYLPWMISDTGEISLLTNALEQGLEVCLKYKDKPQQLMKYEDKYLARIPGKGKAGSEWKEEWIPVPEYNEDELYDDVRFNQIKLEQIAGAKSVSDQTWEIGLFVLPGPIQDGRERPYFANMMLVADEHSQMVLAHPLIHPDGFLQRLPDTLLELFEAHDHLPARIRWLDRDVQEVCEKILQRLNIASEMIEGPSLVAQIFEQFLRQMPGNE